MVWDAIVVGGGCAGLAAATRLAELSHKVLLLESRSILGGRASSFRDEESGEVLDNGQHLFLGCYKETRKWLNRIGSSSDLVFSPSFRATFMGEEGKSAELHIPNFPAPFHLLWGLLGFKTLSLKERVGLVRVARSAQKGGEELGKLSVSDWLSQLGQSHQSQTRFWIPLTLATINVSPDQAPADLLATVLRRAFLSSSSDASVGLSRVGLSELFGSPSRRFLEGHAFCELRTGVSVTQVERETANSERARGVRLANGSMEHAKVVILAVPPPALSKLIPNEVDSLKRWIEPCQQLRSSSILSVHAWTHEAPFAQPFIGFWEKDYHWVFRRSAITGDINSRYVTFVTSAADQMIERSKGELKSMAEDDLNGLRPHRPMPIERVVVVRERDATWVPSVGSLGGRLPIRTPWSNLFLSGDWTDTGLPATIEGAVQSGHSAAEVAQGHLRKVRCQPASCPSSEPMIRPLDVGH